MYANNGQNAGFEIWQNNRNYCNKKIENRDILGKKSGRYN